MLLQPFCHSDPGPDPGRNPETLFGFTVLDSGSRPGMTEERAGMTIIFEQLYFLQERTRP